MEYFERLFETNLNKKDFYLKNGLNYISANISLEFLLSFEINSCLAKAICLSLGKIFFDHFS